MFQCSTWIKDHRSKPCRKAAVPKKVRQRAATPNKANNSTDQILFLNPIKYPNSKLSY